MERQQTGIPQQGSEPPREAELSAEEAAARYFEAMTNDCADPDDGTARTHEQLRKDWQQLGIVK